MSFAPASRVTRSVGLKGVCPDRVLKASYVAICLGTPGIGPLELGPLSPRAPPSATLTLPPLIGVLVTALIQNCCWELSPLAPPGPARISTHVGPLENLPK